MHGVSVFLNGIDFSSSAVEMLAFVYVAKQTGIVVQWKGQEDAYLFACTPEQVSSMEMAYQYAVTANRSVGRLANFIKAKVGDNLAGVIEMESLTDPQQTALFLLNTINQDMVLRFSHNQKRKQPMEQKVAAAG